MSYLTFYGYMTGFFQDMTHKIVILSEIMEYDTYLSNLTLIPLIILLSIYT